MNFNFGTQPEYDLNTGLIKEMISLYGVLVKFLIAEKINVDDNVFGDYSHLKSNGADIHEMYMLPQDMEDWESDGFNFTDFGLTNFENIVLFVPKDNFNGILEVQEITGNLIIFPNNKIMEITDTDATTPGINNLFTEANAKSVYQLTCKPYYAKLTTELEPEDIAYNDGESYDTLNNYFDELVDIKDEQTFEAEVKEQVDVVTENPGGVDTITEEPIVNNDEKSVWGEFD